VAEIVAGVGVPHTVAYPRLVAEAGPDHPIARKYERARALLRQADVDGLVVFACDHINTFFFDNWPTFSIAVAESVAMPLDTVDLLTRCSVPADPCMASYLHDWLVTHDLDLSLAMEVEADHGIAVPLHFLTPRYDVPVVLIFINGIRLPMPSPRRVHHLGLETRRAIQAWSQARRVGIVCSGAFSLEVGGPRIGAGQLWGVPDPAWAACVSDLLAEGQVEQLLDAMTTEGMTGAGNASGELLSWIAAVGALGDRPPLWLRYEAGEGHAFAGWSAA
jgi:Catalytic LigB subunit of aromatic ring-opening dioxygenase